MAIEQAIFTSAVTQRASGYHLACRSSGIDDVTARELSAWGPSHDSLVESTGSAQSLNFFSLSSGAYCVSRTVAAGEEYSERGGVRVFTRCLVVSPADLARFANNPFAVIRAALAAGELEVPEVLPQWLEPVALGGRASRIDHAVLYRLSSRVSPDEVIRLITAAFEHRRLLVITDVDAELLVAGVINTLPVDRRTELSFTTGLRFSPQRPVRLLVLPLSEESEARRAAHAGTAVFQFQQPAVLA